MENNVYFKPNQQSKACFSSAMSGTNGRRPLGKAKGNMKIKTLLLLFISLLPSAMRAYVDVGNLYYTLDEYYKFAEVWGYGNIPEDGNIDIPASIYYEGQSYIVTSISSGAFYGCTGLTSITIPSNVERIGSRAFAGCTGLTSISVDEKNSIYDSRDNCNAIIETSSNTLISGCKNTIIPSTVTSIENEAFYEHSSLTSITIPNSVTEISTFAFYGCTGLTSITIPSNVERIGSCAFAGCTGLTSISVDEKNSTYDSRDNCNAIIETSSNTLISGCKSTIIPGTVTSIGNDAFYKHSSLTSITIPNSVTSIGYNAFYSCTGLTSVTIPGSVTSIGRDAFDHCSGLTSITVDKNNSVYDSRDNCNAIIGTSSNTLILGCKNTIIPSTVTSIGKNAFLGCSGLTSITIPNSVTKIDESAFAGCSGLTSITIPNSVTKIDESAFADCSGLTSVVINNSKVEFDGAAFAGVSAVFDWPDDFEYGGYSSLDEFIDMTIIESFQLAEKTSVTISDAGVATFYSFRGLDFSNVEGLEAYIANDFNKKTSRLTMLQVTEVPAYTGLLLVGAPGTYEIPYKASKDITPVGENLLAGTIEAITIPSTDDDKTNFVLYASSGKDADFRPLAKGFNLKANRAYLQLPTADLPDASPANISIEFVETTGIGRISVLSDQSEQSDAWYTLDGRKLNGTPTQKGIYIHKGRKIVK